ncbi:MAG TPA: RecX family transcriptional regulator [Candidatus Saccharimonadia bacterium]|nr:RecX family transcriptional regulator [Candidatus Saccharimonadia bacterium]
MPVITDITTQKRAQTRYSIYLDNTYSFSLTDLELSTSGLRVGQSLTADEVLQWQQQSVDGKAYQAALRYLGYRPRSRREVHDQLVRKDYEAAVIERTLERLEEHGLIDDRAFAEAWVASRQALKPRSRYVLEQELAQKGVAREVAQATVADIGASGHQQMLDAVIAKKRKQVRYQDPKVLMEYLARQGFKYDQIKEALSRLDD